MRQDEELQGLLAAEVGTEGTLHLTDGELIGYQRGELEELEEERIRSHLVLCAECRDSFFAVKAFLAPENEPESLSQRDIERGWESLRRRLPFRDHEQTSARQDEQPRPFKERPPLRAFALAASLFAVVGLGLLSLQLLHRMRELQAPRLNAPVHELFPQDANQRTGGGVEVQTLTLPSAAASLLLILNGQDLPQFPRYAVELLDESENTVWAGEGLVRNAFGNFSLTVESTFFRPGQYTLRLYGIGGYTRRRVIGEYPFSIAE